MRAMLKCFLHVEELESRIALSTFYVAPTGNDGNAGTKQAPFATLQNAMMSLEPGDTLNVEPGSYDGFIVGWDDPTRADSGDRYGDIVGTAKAPITIQADPSAATGSVIINSKNDKTRYGIDIEPGCDYVNLIGFTIADSGQITSSAGRGGGIKIASPNCGAIGNAITNIVYGFGILADNANNVVLQGNTISGTGNEGDANFGHGIYLSGSTDGAVVKGNVVYNNSYIGIHVNGDLSEGDPGLVTHALIEDNVIYNNGQNGINADGLQNSIIENNLIYGYQDFGIALYQIDAADGSKNNIIVNNTIVSTVSDAGAAVRILNAGTGNAILNNILLGGSGVDLRISSDSMSGLVSNYNIGGGVYQSEDDDSTQTLAQWRTQTGLDAQSSIATATQLFLNVAANNYHLADSSPALNAGTSKDAPSTDINGNPRPSSGGYDIGAYQDVLFHPATQIAITMLTSSSVTAGGTVTLTVTAEDGNGSTIPNYTGTVQLSSTDNNALFNAGRLPANYTFIGSDGGSHSFTVTLQTAGTETITVTDQGNKSLTVVTPAIIVSAAPFSKYVVNVPDGNIVTAGNAFIVTTQAADQFGNPVNTFSGPVTFTTTDPLVATLPSTMVTNGIGVTLGTLKTVANGPWTITAASGTSTGTSGSITVMPGSAVYFTVTAPKTVVTNTSFPITVMALDSFNNVATNFTGTVNLSTTDSAAALAGDLGGNYTFTSGTGQDNGVHTFNVKLSTNGSQKITAADTIATVPAILGTSPPIATSGLAVTALTKTPTGFTATFNQPINPADLTIFGTGNTRQDVLLVGTKSNNAQPYPGTLIVDGSKKLVTFNASANFLAASNPGGSAVLPDDTYTVTLVSGVGNNGFQDVSGHGFDDGHGGHADFVGTFTTTYQADKAEVLGIPDFARGPNASGDTSTRIMVPNDPANGGHVGIPITLYNASNLTSAGFTLTYNANILTVTGGLNDPSNAGASFTMTGSPVLQADGIHAVATFAFTNAAPLSGTQVLGDIIAYVPYSARSQYQVKDLLALGAITVSGGTAVVPANAVDVDAYFGDVNADHHLDGLDKGFIANVASTVNTGFAAFTLLDPAIIGDLSGDNAVTANSTSLLSNYLLGLPVAKIPALPSPPIVDNLFTSPFASDPALSLPASIQASSHGIVNVPVLLDHPRPKGSTGLVEAEVTLQYDPAVLSVTAADITLGSIPSQGTGWQLSATVNAAIGQINIRLFSQTPIAIDQFGSLVNVAFHIKPDGKPVKTTKVQLLDSQTVLADAQAAMILSPGLNWSDILTNDWVQSLV